MNKTAIGIIIAIVVIAGGAYLISRTSNPANTSSSVTDTNATQSSETTNNTTATKPSNKVSAASGHMVFSVTDAAADMQTIDQINLKINSVEVHSAAKGWVTVSSTPKTYDLLKLNTTNKSELLADVGVKAGTYDQVRLKIGSVSVTTKAGSTIEAKLPSNDFKINTKIVMSADKVSSVNFDFLADKSLHTTGSGEFIFAPVIKTDSKSGASVDIDTADNTVSIVGGQSDSATVVGMDIDGSVKVNFQIDPNKKLMIDSKNVIKIDGVLP